MLLKCNVLNLDPILYSQMTPNTLSGRYGLSYIVKIDKVTAETPCYIKSTLIGFHFEIMFSHSK